MGPELSQIICRLSVLSIREFSVQNRLIPIGIFGPDSPKGNPTTPIYRAFVDVYLPFKFTPNNAASAYLSKGFFSGDGFGPLPSPFCLFFAVMHHSDLCCPGIDLGEVSGGWPSGEALILFGLLSHSFSF